MVDHRYQKHGYGARALKQVIEYVRQRPGACELLTSVVPGEGSPGSFYEKMGFIYTGDIDEGERVMRKACGLMTNQRNLGTMRGMLAGMAIFAQSLPGAGSTGGTGPVSPSVLATTMAVVDAAGRGTLELLVLWRGNPGWFMKGGGGSSSGGGGSTGPTLGGAPSPMIRSSWISQGGVNLGVRFDPAAQKAWIQDNEIDLR